ncbi:MAG: hypothetical protein ACTHKG_15695 [Nocardioides sp.]
MTATAGAASTSRTSRPSATPAEAFTRVFGTAVDYAVAKASRATESWTDKLTRQAEGAGAAQRAGVRGAKASLRGQNPVWAAIKGAWSGSTATVKAAIVAALVALLLMLILSPVLLLAFLLSLLVVAAVTQARRAQR